MWFISIDFMSDMKSCCLNCKGGSIKEHFKPFYYLAYLGLILGLCPFKKTWTAYQMFIKYNLIKLNYLTLIKDRNNRLLNNAFFDNFSTV